MRRSAAVSMSLNFLPRGTRVAEMAPKSERRKKEQRMILLGEKLAGLSGGFLDDFSRSS